MEKINLVNQTVSPMFRLHVSCDAVLDHTLTTEKIDFMGVKLAASKGLGSLVTVAKNEITYKYECMISEHLYSPTPLVDMLSHWLEKSSLTGEPRRTAKEALQRAVKQLGQGEITLEIVERKTGNKERGIHLTYIDEQEQEKLAYQASVKALVSAFKKHGHTVYDALAIIEMEKQEIDKASKTSAINDIEATTVNDAMQEQVNQERDALLSSLMS